MRADEGVGTSTDAASAGGSTTGGDYSLVEFSRLVLDRPLRWYQAEIARAVERSIREQLGLTFTVMMARQMGKNELSAHLEAWLLDRMADRGGTIVKAAPTFRPQIANSMVRLESLLRRPHFQGRWRREHGHMLALGEARIAFFSAEPRASVVGATASLLLEIDEAQAIDPEKYSRDFRPMAAATNATTVLYGTAWTGDTLLEQERRRNLEAEAAGGERCHFSFDWQVGAEVSAAYKRFVRSEIARLGERHPLIRTQYLLECVPDAGALFSDEQRLLLRGTHARQRAPQPLEAGSRYVAAIDVAGGAEEAAVVGPGSDAALRQREPRKDSTVAGIAQVTPAGDGGMPLTQLVEIYWWTGRPLHEQCDRLVHLLRDVWRCGRVVVDASGLGADLAARLERALGSSTVEPFVFSVPSKSRLAYHLLSHVNSGRLHMWSEDHLSPAAVAGGERAVPSAEAAEFWREVERVRPVLRAGGQLGFYVPESQGHDDFVTMLALLSWATRDIVPVPAFTLLRPRTQHTREGRY